MSENKELGDAVDKFRALLADCTESERRQAKAIFCDVLGITEAALRTHENESEALAYAVWGINADGEHYLRGVYPVFEDWAIDDCSLGERWAGNDLLYLAPSAKAIETAAIMKCAELMVKRGVLSTDGLNYEALLALIPQDGRTALEELLLRAFREGTKIKWTDAQKMRGVDGLESAIVTNLIGVPPLSSETVSGEGE